MSSKANILKKFRKWLRRAESSMPTARISSARSSLSVQVGKLLRERGSEVITMTTL